jgi:hypothetical protein
MEKCRRPWLASEVLLVVVSLNQPNSRAERSLSGSRPTAVEVILIVGGEGSSGCTPASGAGSVGTFHVRAARMQKFFKQLKKNVLPASSEKNLSAKSILI